MTLTTNPTFTNLLAMKYIGVDVLMNVINCLDCSGSNFVGEFSSKSCES